jgi:hypothetical protein
LVELLSEAPSKTNCSVANETTHFYAHLMGCQGPSSRCCINNFCFGTTGYLQPPMMRVIDKALDA